MASTLWPVPGQNQALPTTDPTQLNQNLPGLAQTVSKVTQSPNYQALQSTNDASDIQPGSVAEKLGAIDTGLYKSLPFGLGPALLGKLFPKQSEQMQKAAEANPKLATAGEIAGSLGQGLEMPALGAGAFKGAAGVIPSALARNAITAGAVAMPGAITEAAQTGNIGDALKHFALNTGIGAVGGTILEKGIGAISKAIPKIKRGVANASLEGDIGIQSRPFKQVVTGIQNGNQPGNIINRADEIRNQIVDLANVTKGTPYDISTEAGKMATVQKMENDWDTQVDGTFKAFQGQGGHLSDLRNTIYTDPTVQEVINAHPEMIDKLDSIIDTASNTADTQGIGSARNYLRKQVINFGMRNGASDDAYLSAQLGGAVHGAVDNAFVPPELKDTYARDLLIKKVLASEELKIPAIAKSGSATAARLLTHAAMAGAGGILPGAAAVGIGGIINDVTSGAINKGLGKLATKISPAIQKMTGEGLQSLGSQAGPLASKIGGLGSLSGGGGLMDILNGPTTPTGTTLEGSPGQPQQASIPDQVQPVPIPGAPAGAQPIPNSQPNQISSQPVVSPQQQFDQAGQPGPVESGKWNPTLVQQRLQEKYARHVRMYGQDIPFEQFASDVMQGTNGLDPMNPDTWHGMIDDRDTADKLYKSYMNLQKIGDVDPGSALNHYTRLLQLGNRIAPAQQLKETEDNAKLVAALSDMTGQTAKDIDSRLKTIAWSRGKTPDQKKKAVMDMIVKEGGVDVPLLVKMGLWGG